MPRHGQESGITCMSFKIWIPVVDLWTMRTAILPQRDMNKDVFRWKRHVLCNHLKNRYPGKPWASVHDIAISGPKANLIMNGVFDGAFYVCTTAIQRCLHLRYV